VQGCLSQLGFPFDGIVQMAGRKHPGLLMQAYGLFG